MGISRGRKEQTYLENIEVLTAIKRFGGIVPTNLLEKICLRFKQVSSKKSFKELKNELVEGGMIRLERFTVGEVMILKKGAIVFLEGAKNSEEVAGISGKTIHLKVKVINFKLKFLLLATKTSSLSAFSREFEQILGYKKQNYSEIVKRLIKIATLLNLEKSNIIENEIYKYQLLDKFQEVKRTEKGFKEEMKEFRKKGVLDDKSIEYLNKKRSFNKEEQEMLEEIGVKVKENEESEKIKQNNINYQIANNCYCIRSKVHKDLESESKYIIELDFIVISSAEKTGIAKIAEVIARTIEYFQLITDHDLFRMKFKFFIIGEDKQKLRRICEKKTDDKVNKKKGFTIIENAVAKNAGTKKMINLLQEYKNLKIKYIEI